MSMGYQPIPTESSKCSALGPAWLPTATCCSVIVVTALIRRPSRMYGYLDKPSAGPRHIRPQQQVREAGAVAGLGLQPVREAEADPLGILKRGGEHFGRLVN